MAELLWSGKYVDGVRRDPCRVVPSLAVEEVYRAGQTALLNRVLWGDKKDVLAALLPEHAGRVDLVYIDPPFETGSSFDFLASIPGTTQSRRVALNAFHDARGLDGWLAWFFDTAVLLHELLREGGSLYVHLDAHAAHYAKIVLDEVFGAKSFQREIIWRIGWVSGFKSRARGWIRNHDTLLFFAKGPRPRTFHKEYVAYPDGYLRRDGSVPKGAGHPIDDVWNGSGVDRLDSIQIMSFSGEKVGYPTQKNEALLSRIIRASSDPGDLVLDCFVGSGTTAVVSEQLGRRWVVADASPFAIHATRKRLLAIPDIRPFALERVLGEEHAAISPHRAEVAVSKHSDGLVATIELTGFCLGAQAMPPAACAVSHWSQWIEGWCVDWQHDSGPMQVGTSVWRARSGDPIVLCARHVYPEPGLHRAMVRIFDALGGWTSVAVDLDLAASACG